MNEFSIDISEEYSFSKSSINDIKRRANLKENWPTIYILKNKKELYIGESTRILSRINTHLNNKEKSVFNGVIFITSESFNKSVTLDMESKLIQYLSAECLYKIYNKNYGLINHDFYQKIDYELLFNDLWSKLRDKRMVDNTLIKIRDTDLFIYSPYKPLNDEQYESSIEILNCLVKGPENSIFVEGSAGTGKTVLAIYLMKLLLTSLPLPIEDQEDSALLETDLVWKFQKRKRNPDKPRRSDKLDIALVIAMTSLRQTLKKVFRHVGLSADLVIGPSDVANYPYTYDLLIIDEAHRLRQDKNLSWTGKFRENNKKLRLASNANELDWIIEKSENQVFFYDPLQTVKPSDIDSDAFDKLLASKKTTQLKLKSQMRVGGGDGYITFVNDLLHLRLDKDKVYQSKNYELSLFNSFKEFIETCYEQERKYGLSRIVAGYSWEWLSKEDKTNYDIEIEGIRLRWNSVQKDWVYSAEADKEVGCIHTIQGYEVNYLGVIFGREISYNKEKNIIEINPEFYLDKNGKKGIYDIEKLKNYIVNIYRVFMTRGTKGTFVYVCDEELRRYLNQHIPSYKKSK